MKDKLARDIMTSPAVSAGRRDSLSEVTRILDRHNIRGVPVTDDEGKVVGVISEKDMRKYTHFVLGQPVRDLCEMCRTLEEREEEARGSTSRSIDMLEAVATATTEVIMTDKVISVTEETPVMEIVRLLNKHNINRLPVVDSEEKLVGVVSKADVLKLLEAWADNS